jgi:hypothetical protein
MDIDASIANLAVDLLSALGRLVNDQQVGVIRHGLPVCLRP